MIHDPYISKSHRHTELYKTVKYAVSPSVWIPYSILLLFYQESLPISSFLKLHPFTSMAPHSWQNAVGVEVILEDAS